MTRTPATPNHDDHDDHGGVDDERKPAGGLSYRLRLTLIASALFLVIQLGGMTVFWLYQGAAVERTFREAIEQRLRAIETEFDGRLTGLGRTDLAVAVNRDHATAPLQRFMADVLDERGVSIIEPDAPRLLINEPSSRDVLSGGVLVWAGNAVFRSDDAYFDNEHATVAMMPVRAPDGASYILAVASPASYPGQVFGLTRNTLVTMAAFNIIASGVAAWLIAGAAVRPFDRLRQIAKSIKPDTIESSIDTRESSSPEVRELLDELDHARERIAEGFRMQERFLSNVSHEIKTPIAVTIMEAEALRNADLSEEGAAFVRSTREEMSRLGNLVESFLTLTRITDTESSTPMRRYLVNELVMDCVESCEAFGATYGVTISPHLLSDDDGLDLSVRGDPDLLRTMLDNLVRNAIRFSPRLSRVQIVARRVDSDVIFDVLDEGPGIPPEMLDRIFDRFAQVPEEQRRGRGHGLGLAIAQGIAELHGGVIVAENRPDGGAMMTVRLPLPTLAQPAQDE